MSSWTRTILHFDLDAFFCSVESLLNPGLEGRAFVVGGSAESRGVVSSASYAAREFGIRSAMPTAQALRKAPDLIVISPQHAMYSEHSHEIMSFLRDSTPVVEQLSIDEAFLDVSDDPRTGPEVARFLQREILKRFKLPTSWGVASNKLVAKIATEVGKPEGLIVVPSGQEATFLAPLPVRMLWGVGPKTKDRLAERGVHTIGDMANMSAHALIESLGDNGLELASRARGEDDRPVMEGRDPKSMSAERTFSTDISDWPVLRTVILRLSETVGRRLRKAELAGHTIRIKVRWPDFTTKTRQVRLEQPTDRERIIFDESCKLFQGLWKKGQAVRLLGVGVSDLHEPIHQLDLFDRQWDRDERLQQAIDSIRNQYGPDSLRRAGGLRKQAPSERDEQPEEDVR
ncbi:MAG: DNA polymerase IV [Anaerolineales bacterium]|nr:MAG: DNA polymerase IV [Anaerolineales bacterium]